MNVNLHELSYAVTPQGRNIPKTLVHPFDYQLAAIEQTGMRSNPLMGHRPGAGKTGIALATMSQFTESEPCIVICPPSLVGQWVRNAEKWLGLPFTALTSEREIVGVLDEPLSVLPARYVVPDSLIHIIPQNAYFTMVVVDEVHRMKTRDARRTRALFGSIHEKGLAQRCCTFMGLSGTPILNSPIEIYGYAKHAGVAGAFSDFTARYSPSETRHMNGRQILTYPNATNSEELTRLLRSSFLIRPRSADIDLQLPPVREEDFLLSIATTKTIDYERVAAIFEGATCSEEEKESISTLRRELGEKKAIKSIPYLEDVMSGGDAPVIFCHHRNVAEIVAAELLCGCIHGGTPMREREKQIAAFVAGGSALVATIGAMGTGIDGLQSRSDLMIFIERSYVPADQEQAIARLVRLGQRKSVRVVNMVTKDSIDHAIDRCLRRKTKNVENTLT